MKTQFQSYQGPASLVGAPPHPRPLLSRGTNPNTALRASSLGSKTSAPSPPSQPPRRSPSRLQAQRRDRNRLERQNRRQGRLQRRRQGRA